MTVLRYPLTALIADYALGISSTAICLVILVTLGSASSAVWVFVALTLGCLAYTIRTVLQQKSIFEWDDQGLTRNLLGSVRRIDWDHLSGFSLRYYPRKRARKKGAGTLLGKLSRRGIQDQSIADEKPRSPFADGWMELTLHGANKQRITLESGLPHFFTVTERAAEAARAKGLELDAVSDDNLRALVNLPAEFRSDTTTQNSTGPHARMGR